MTFFMERNNLRITCVVPLILYSTSVYDFKFNPFIFKSISSIGRLSLEFLLSHGFALAIVHFDNYIYKLLCILFLTIFVSFVTHLINIKVSTFLQKRLIQ